MTGLPITPRTLPLSTPAVQAALLKNIGQQLAGAIQGEPLKVGQVLQARIAAGPGGEPVLTLGGVRVPAQLPGNVQVGQFLRLRVQDVTAERVTLQIVSDPAQTAATAASAATGAADELGAAAGPNTAQAAQAQQAGAAQMPWAAIPMPGGATARLFLDPDKGGPGGAERSGDRSRTMVVRYDSPLLGRTDVVLRLDADQLEAAVLAHGGAPLDLVRSTVPALRAALVAAVDRRVAIVTGGRADEELDVRA